MNALWVAIAAAIVTVVAGSFMTFVAFIARELYRVARTLDRTDERTISLERRVDRLEEAAS